MESARHALEPFAAGQILLVLGCRDRITCFQRIFDPSGFHFLDDREGFSLSAAMRNTAFQFCNPRNPISILIQAQSNGVRKLKIVVQMTLPVSLHIILFPSWPLEIRERSTP